MSSKAQGQTTIKFISKAGTFSAYCTCTWGDLYQMYSSATSGAKLVPNFGPTSSLQTADRPMVEFHVNSSRLTDVVELGDPEIFVGNTKLTFGLNDVSQPPYAGVFERVLDSQHLDKIGLRVLDDFADKVGFASFVITFRAKISVNGQQANESIQAFYDVSVLQGTESAMRVMITEVPSPGQSLHGFTIRKSDDQVTLKAVVRTGTEGQPLQSTPQNPLTYEWFRYDSSAGDWAAFSPAKTAEKLEVTEDMVDTYSAFMVKVTYNGEELPTDMQGVWDAQDALQMVFDAVPDDFTIEEGNPNRQRVYLWPKVLNAGVQDMSYTRFRFAIHGSSGEVVNDNSILQTSDITDIGNEVYSNRAILDYSGKSKPLNAAVGQHYPDVFYVNQAAMQQAGGDVSVTCETVV